MSRLLLLLVLPGLAGCALGLDPFMVPDDYGADSGGPGGGGEGGDEGGDEGGGNEGGGDEGGGDEGGDEGGGEGGTIEIDRVAPSWGTTAGGDEVTITGGPFDSSSTVRFGGETATVARRSSSELVVETPDYSGVDEGSGKESVTVEVTNDDGSTGESRRAFTYYLDGEGKAGVIGSLDWYDYVGGYWDTSVTDYGGAWVAFITPPVDTHYWDLFAPDDDTCTDSSYDYSAAFGDIYMLDMGASSITLSAGSRSLTLYEDADLGGYANRSDLSASQLPSDASMDLEELDGDFAPEAFSVDGFASTASSFIVTSPSIGGSTPPGVNQSSLQFRWTGGSGDKILLQLLVVDPDTYETSDAVYCVARDDGEFTVSASEWRSSWPRGDYLYIYVGSAVEEGSTLPYNNADTRVAGIYWSVGVGLMP